jgi:hypothetical protein
MIFYINVINMAKEITCILLDGRTKQLLDDYGEKHSISRSAAIRLILNHFFLKGGKL